MGEMTTGAPRIRSGLLIDEDMRISVAFVPANSRFAEAIQAAADALHVDCAGEISAPAQLQGRVVVVDLTDHAKPGHLEEWPPRLGPRVLAISDDVDLDCYDVVPPAHVPRRLARALANLVEREVLRTRLEAAAGRRAGPCRLWAPPPASALHVRGMETRPPTFRWQIALISCAALLLEVSYTRVVSFKFYYFFAYLVLGFAMLGLGSGGAGQARATRANGTKSSISERARQASPHERPPRRARTGLRRSRASARHSSPAAWLARVSGVGSSFMA